jgi:5-methylcytosine-specific restriction endonuclease McrA
MAACDAQHLAELLPRAAKLRAANENASLDADPAAGAHHTPAVTNAHESTATRQSSDHAHVDAQNRQSSDADARPSRGAKQSIPPALRRAVLTRDRHRCRVPGCTHATFVDVHHVEPRSEGGRNEASNLLVLCSAHHRATHRGELLIHREHEGAFTFRHADGAAYGSPTAPRFVDAYAKVFAALRHLGFREGEVKAVLGELRGDAGLVGASVEHLLREALRRIRPTAR